MSHTPAPGTHRSTSKVLKPLAVFALTAGLSCSALSAASAARAVPVSHSSAGVVVTEVPVINTAPEDVTATSGEFVWFAASSSDSEAVQQWQVSELGTETFVDIPGANAVYLELDSVSYAQNGLKYRASFTNADGTAYTDAATLTVLASQPDITSGPESVRVASGAPFAFTASAEADPAPSVRWQVRKEDGVVQNIPGATSDQYSGTAPTTAYSGWRYRAVFTNAHSSVVTGWAVLTVTALKPSVVTAPVNVTVDAGKVATFTARAKADPAPRAQWQVRVHGTGYFEDIPGATRNAYSFKPTKAESGNLYRVRYTNSAGEVTTGPRP